MNFEQILDQIYVELYFHVHAPGARKFNQILRKIIKSNQKEVS